MSSLDFETLSRPLPAWNPKAWFYALARFLLGSIGRLSRGIGIGFEHGFDSGVMLDHVYENRPEGVGPLGRAIDRVFLNAPGWRGIRNRGALVEATIADAVREASVSGRPVRLADVACGGGRYVLEALAAFPPGKVEATLRDYRPENVARTRANAARLGVAATVEQADAFADAGMDKLGPLDIVVVSGLHEIIQDDGLVERHFRQIARVLRPGGRLILTIQPDHPQLEFIARVLTSHTGRKWVMRLRPAALTRQWLEAAGFRVERLDMEAEGIFGVIQARKR